MSFSTEERDQDLCRFIVEAASAIERYVDGLDATGFSVDRKTQDAVAMRLQQVLECANKLSNRVKTELCIDWPSMIAMRNKISHSYVDVDAKVVWEVIREFEEFQQLISWAKTRI